MRTEAKSGEVLLECRGVSAGYGTSKGEPIRVLSSVTFAVPQAGRLVILGRSGSGKSTLLRLLNRFDDPLAGEVRFRGRRLAQYDPRELRRKIALVLQTPTVFDGTVRENLGVRPKGTPEPDESSLVTLLEEVGLGKDFMNRSAGALSVGEKQRLCLARALVAGPDVLLLDEPTSALDPRSLGIVADLVTALADHHGLAVVVATHQPELVRKLGGKILLLEHGTARLDPPDADVDAFFEGE